MCISISYWAVGGPGGLLLEALPMEGRGRKQIGQMMGCIAAWIKYSTHPLESLKLGWPFRVVLSWDEGTRPLSQSLEEGYLRNHRLNGHKFE